MNAVFTIVAKNYLSFAITLADSVKKSDPDTPFYIFLADSREGLDESYFAGYNIIPVKELHIAAFTEMAFKYNVTEFSTAIKPFCIEYLFGKMALGKVIYLDPDIYVYSSVNAIFGMLNSASAVITPHFLTMEEDYTGNNPEKEMLFSGIYNLGFIALKKTDKIELFVKWWKKRLTEYCYGDRMESLHVDQKWIDFLPAFLTPDELMISRHPGLNIAYWNIHERTISINNGIKSVSLKQEADKLHDLIFLHFSGLNPLNINVNKQCPTINVDDYPEWKQLITDYAPYVLKNDFSKLYSLSYAFNTFDNGEVILPFHRRMYRRLLELSFAQRSVDPFSTGQSGFFELLKRNRLLTGNAVPETKISEENLTSSVQRIKKINMLLKFTLRLIGLKNYITLLRFCQKYFRPENQIFLISEYRKVAEETYFKV